MNMNPGDETTKKFDLVNTLVESDLVISSSLIKTAAVVDYTGRTLMQFPISPAMNASM